MKTIFSCRLGSNMHGHLRLSPEMLRMTASHAAFFNYYYTAMGNHKGWPTTTPDRAMEYRGMINEYAPTLRANVPCYMQEAHDPEEIKLGYGLGAWIASKFYPRGVTTNSDEGVRPNMFRTLYPAYEMHAELGMLALFHGMRPHDPIGREIDWFEQEKRFIDLLGELLVRVPKLKVVYEHLTTLEGLSFIKYCQANDYQVEFTVAPQYLLHNRNWLFANGINPGHYSIPPLQDALHQEGLIEAVTSGYGYRGNDSAPHDHKAKERYIGCAGGIYSDVFGLDLIAYFMVFKAMNALRHFESFVALKGPAFYGLEPTPGTHTMHIVEKTWSVPKRVRYEGGYVVPLFAGQKLPYKVVVERPDMALAA